VLEARALRVTYGSDVAVRNVDLELVAGQVVALMGRNGSGKSSLLWALQGSGPRAGGTVGVAGTDPAALSPARARRLVGLVPQTPADLLFLDTVADECAQADEEAAAAPGATRAILDRLAAGLPAGRHPRDLSEGQRLEGRAVVVATHDVEFAATAADRVVVMATGEVVADGPAHRVLTASPAFAPQAARIFAPVPVLTVTQVAGVVGEGPAGAPAGPVAGVVAAPAPPGPGGWR
jgi:energy-coupling factor transport system ATP-binding protein